MIDDLKSYSSYKDSEVPFLGEIPEHWEQRALWTVSKVRKERSHPDLPLLSVFLDRGVIRYEEGGGQVHAPSLDLSTYQVVHPGDFVLNNQQAWRGSVGVSRHHGIISPAYIVLELSKMIDSSFANYLVRCPAMVHQFVEASKGVGDIQRQIYWPFLRVVQVPIPPLDEQVAITQFLNDLDSRIRRYVGAKQKLIKLLEEQRRAIINRAVTRGIDSAAIFKPSGTPWLGNIPEHWNVSRSKHLFSVRKELSRPDDVQLSATQAYGVIPQAEFEERVGRRVVKISMHLEKRRHVEKDDFVISMRSFQGGLERAWASGAIRSSYVVLQPGPSADVEFFSYLFKSPGYIRALQSTADFIRDGQDLTFDNFCRVDLPLVPLEEQRAIATAITRVVSGIASNIAKVTSELDLIREYRNRLIADVVTGKLDAREVAASLPDEISQDKMILDEMEPVVEDDLEDSDLGLETSLEEVEA